MAYARDLLHGALVLTVVYSSLASAAEPANKPNEDAKGAVRLNLLHQLAEEVQVSINSGDKLQPIKMLPEPLYRYSQQSRFYPDAVVWGWLDHGRPKALLTLACQVETNSTQLIYEFNSLSANPLFCTIDGQDRWAPRGPGVTMKTLPGAPAPVDDKEGRLRQINALLAGLKATEIIIESGQQKTLDLAWATKPIYRYSDPTEGIVDGALCFACIETNPEVLIVLEAQRRPNSPPSWYCGFNRITYAELHVRRDDKDIWTAPPLQGTSFGGSYHLIPVTLPR
jgi:hypothetical protein